jgi:hypothetical protein
MTLFIGILITLWALMGTIVLGFVSYNIATKGHKPLTVVPVVLTLIIGFGYSVVTTFYYANQASESFTSQIKTTPNAAPTKSSLPTNLYR